MCKHDISRKRAEFKVDITKYCYCLHNRCAEQTLQVKPPALILPGFVYKLKFKDKNERC